MSDPDDDRHVQWPSEFEAYHPGVLHPMPGYRCYINGKLVDGIRPYQSGDMIRVERVH